MKRRILRYLPVPFLGGVLSSVDLVCGASCPYGLVNDPYPGQCPRFTDMNVDGICDLSQVNGAADYSADDDNPQKPAETDQGDVNASDTANTSEGLVDDGADHLSQHDTDYHVIPISIMITGTYLLTHYLFSRGYLTRSGHRRTWNILLTVGYAGTGFTGMMLIVFIRLGIRTILNPAVTYWHAELAVLMVMATFIHIHLYRKPLLSMFRQVFSS